MQLSLILQLSMRRNPTLPTIRQSISVINSAKSKEGVQSYRKIEDKINSHDEQIVKNEKIISNLANEFRMLKEQLEFEQQYNEKYKNTMNKYEEETSKQLKVIKDQKQIIAKLEHISKQKDKNLELINKEKSHLKEKNQQFVLSIEQFSRQNKKKDAQLKQMQNQLQKARKDIKQKQSQLKQKEVEIREAFVSDRQIRQSKIKKLQKDVELLNIYLQNSKQQINGKEKQIHRLNLQLFQVQQKIKAADKNQIKAKNLVQEIKLVQRQCQDLKKKLKESEDQNKNLEIAIKTMQSKSTTNNNEKFKQLQQQKKDLNDKLIKIQKQLDQGKKRLEVQRRQREKLEKRDQQVKQKLTKLQSFYDKLMKSKIEINQQLSKLKSNILCDYCSKTMKNPVTNIPCGHSYCQECKAGYLKECKKCSGVKREAVYRNQLLDQIIQASNLIEKMVILMNN